jgi:DNA-directed RNA polymerase specialized sigma24 family protein
MLSPFWAEYARLQSLAERGLAREEQLDRHLKTPPIENQTFDLHTARRKSKNTYRNSRRTEHDRIALIRRYAHDFVTPTLTPDDLVSSMELRVEVRKAAGDGWGLLHDTLDGDYADVAALRKMPVGTLKAKVSRLRSQLERVLKHVDPNC